MIGANFLSGANSRLLPVSVPFRFFMVAMFFYVLFWAVLFIAAEDVTGYIIGSGPVLSLIHVATLGILTMTVIGASLQLLSVATRRSFKGVGLCKLVSWTYIPGVMLLSFSMFEGCYEGMISGAVLTSLGLFIFCGLVLHNIFRVSGMVAIMAHCCAAMGSLLALFVLGTLLIINMEQGFMPDHLSFTFSHFILAVFGFMSLLAMGFSYILVPMFALSPAPSERYGRLSVALSVMGIVSGLVGVILHFDGFLLIGVALGMGGAGIYIYSMLQVYKSRMRKRLGLPFVLIRIGWFFLAVTLLWGGVGVANLWPDHGHVIFGYLAIVGWLLTFLVGVLHRILPFLSSMHTSDHSGIPMLGSNMADERLLSVHFAGHLTGLLGVLVGLIFKMDIVIRISSIVGLIGAGALFVYLIVIVWQLVQNRPETP